MRKSYYLTYGTKNIGVDETEVRLATAFGVQFTRRESLYVGLYSLYKGDQVDELTIEPNCVNGIWKEKDSQDYRTLIYFSNTAGKNADKAIRTEAAKARMAQFVDVTLLKDVVQTNPG